ncbi:MAG: hypothetical protein DBX07_03325 [Candidatus Poseidoniales archaeon]|uniref:SAP domain-containing protein n=1 Tax=uncultured Poseidoniia archaeon TaxID=1697135 RepID=A0A1B1TBE3_9ARCH|nr:hypothetical protein [uncultured Candidatus Thalassoarchaea sp.]MDC0576472.1 hypothetical protein [Euryarchaeota archaeon]RCH74889.1 MAG: hypothetical protein DBX07_04555 [Candidatus Poseidoniales archaeon]RCH75773.1 MAG: hypothetical protein DBX07_03325 [Candidatus Poseidoniales archaeon]|tara:strand:- start:9738 stop:10655 length:918 start_codon:yes stop_codon:yes gene_type:complete
MTLRERAETAELAKSGSVEVLRARLIQHQVLGDFDLSWEGIQSMPHREIGEVLKIFGIKSSGSHKERRQRLWLHLNFDSRRMTIERLAEIDREKLHELCQFLELPLTGNRTVLMGRVAGVLTSQSKGWGRIKRSLRRNGIIVSSKNEEVIINRNEEDLIESENENKKIIPEIKDEVSNAALEDAHDSLMIGFEDADFGVQGDILTIQARVEDLDRMIGTIIKNRDGAWGEKEIDLLIRLAIRRGWPLKDDRVKQRLSEVATNIAEIKGADLGRITDLETNEMEHINRIKHKLSLVEKILSEEGKD